MFTKPINSNINNLTYEAVTRHVRFLFFAVSVLLECWFKYVMVKNQLKNLITMILIDGFTMV